MEFGLQREQSRHAEQPAEEEEQQRAETHTETRTNDRQQIETKGSESALKS